MARKALAVLLLLLLVGLPQDTLADDFSTRHCPADTKIQNPGDEELVEGKLISDWQESITSFVLTKEGFEGVRAEVVHSRGTVTAWFPNMNIDGSQWREMLLEVQKNRAQVTLSMRVGINRQTCNLNIDGGELQPRELKLFGRGPSWWRKNDPGHSCIVSSIQQPIINFNNLPTCTSPPQSGNAPAPQPIPAHDVTRPSMNGDVTRPPPTPPSNPSTSSEGFPVWAIVLVVIILVIVGSGMAVLQVKRRNQRQMRAL